MASTDFLYPPKPAPALNIPGGSIVKVSIINTTGSGALEIGLGAFMSPVQPGHETLVAPVFSFLIENGPRKILFDLGCRQDWEVFAPSTIALLKQHEFKIDIEKPGVASILQENGVDVASGAIEAMIWSHWHFDHIGDPSTFPSSTTLVIGPGVKEAFLPAYPTNPESPLLESDFAGRMLKEMDFSSSSLKIGPFRALDYFNDGSFYLLDCPGHAIGHMCGLARVTNGHEATFVFMGGDVAHHGGEFRPTEYLPLPKELEPSPIAAFQGVCPGHVFEAIHPQKRGDSPYYHIHDGVPHNTEEAQKSCGDMQEFDAAENVFVVIAHDGSLLHPEVGMEWFPEGTLKDWKKKDLARKARWGFLRDFETAVGKSGEQ